MISVVIFSAVILGLAGLAFQVARRGTRATDAAHVMSVLLSRVDRASTVDFDSLGTIAGCDTTARGNVAIYACTTVTAGTGSATVQVIVSTNIPLGRPDTVTMQRGDVGDRFPLR